MEAVGEALLSAAIGLLFDKLASADLLDFARQQWVYSDLKKWEKQLSDIREELNDAENKQITNDSVKAWLGNLKDLAYDMEDILDEFAYEALQRELTAKEADHQVKPSKVRKLISTCRAIFNPTEVMRYINMRSKVWKITRRLGDNSAQRSELGLEKVAAITNSACGRPVSPPHEPHVYGRDADKQIIIQMLLRDEPTATNFSVVSIVAMGGMGKTTLAYMVYYDTAEPIANHFALKARVCVSNEFDKVQVTKRLLNSLPSQSSNSEDFHEIQSQLKKALTGKRFLIVLDDLWSDIKCEWDDLRSPFLEGAPGSKILVTTRDRSVATSIGGHKNLHELKQLSGDDCWSVFQTHAFEHMNIDEHPNLESIGRRIVEKCGGLPLAAKALGGLLRSSEPREREWERVLHSKIWDLPESDVIPALRLSYNHLPSHLKRCFSYCAIFPQDYEFDKEELILLWMAEGLIQQSNDDEEIKDRGDAYFWELLSRSFFQSSSSNKSLFMMHDLINDLAKYVAGDTCLQLHLDDKFKNNLQRPESTRHSTFIPSDYGDYDIFKKFERFHKMEHLRTFIAISTPRPLGIPYMSNKVLQELIPRLGYLRVLSLSSYGINEIPNEFGNLKLLRYLNLSNTLIQCLPDSIGNLFYLQTLKLSRCEKLTRLPISIGNLINLRHLDVTGAIQLQKMPSQIGKLKDLQILSNFIVGKNNSLNIKELKDMSHLRGELCISKLENVVNIQDARDAKLKLKSKLESLMIWWSFELDGSGNERNQMEVLDSLQPCLKNLNKLCIELYGGPEFPRWIRDALFSKMVDLSLIDCRKCSSLPCLGQLPSLKQLRIEGMDGVQKVGAEFYGETRVSTNKFFPSLESLHFVNMSEWEHWEEWSSSASTVSLFPCLHELTIKSCPKLIEKLPTYLPSLIKLSVHNCPKLESPLLRFPLLNELVVGKCNETVLRSGIELTSLTKLTVSNILGLIRLQQGFVRSLGGLQALEFSECEELTCLWEDGFESESLHCHQLVSLGCNLQSLVIHKCHKLERLPNGWQSLTCLEELWIKSCPKLVSFPEVAFPPKLRSLDLLTCKGLKCLPNGMMRNSNGSSNSCVLQSLVISKCSSLICFPKGQLPTTLKTLDICNCANLKSLPEGMMHRNSIATNDTTDMCALECLLIDGCPSLIGFPKGGLPTTLKELRICGCPRLESLPEVIMHHHSTNAAALQILDICECSSLTSFPRGMFPSTLEQLRIRFCEQLESISEEMFHSTHNSLQSLTIEGECPNLKSLPDCLYNLTYLFIAKFKNLELFLPQMKNLTSLTKLHISHSENINTPLSQWGLSRLTSLKILSITGMFPDATSFSDDPHMILLPTTLTSLSLSKFQNLESLASLSLQTLTSLKYLSISYCPNLRSILPREGLLPDTLSLLNIQASPLLQQRFSKEKGEDWPKIAHIPRLDIG